MTTILGHLSASLAAPDEDIPPEMVALINRNVRPPAPITADEVFVRAMFVVSDEVNSFGGRFPLEEHETLAQLLVDSPVLTGHRKDLLPVGRTFHAELVERDGVPWVKAYFYWLRSADSASDLKENIDGGVYKECSIAFTFGFPECSICGEDIRRCEHEPLASYPEASGASCHFNYRHIEKVLETSLVYRGAVKGTSISRVLAQRSDDLPWLDSLESLEGEVTHLMLPRYEGLPVAVCQNDSTLRLTRLDGRPMELPTTIDRFHHNLPDNAPLHGRLVAYRGRERCSREQLVNYLDGVQSQVTRTVLYLYPTQGIIKPSMPPSGARFALRELPYRVGRGSELANLIDGVATRDGVEIWTVGASGCFLDGPSAVGYRFRHGSVEKTKAENASLSLDEKTGVALLRVPDTISVDNDTSLSSLSFRDFDLAALREGMRLVSEVTAAQSSARTGTRVIGEVTSFERHGHGYRLSLDRSVAGHLLLRPIRLHGSRRFLLHVDSRATTTSAGGTHGRQ